MRKVCWAQVLARPDAFTVTKGEVLFSGKNLLELQLPVEFAGADPTDVGTADLARTNPDGVSPLAGGGAVDPSRISH